MLAFLGVLVLIGGVVMASFREIITPLWIWIALLALLLALTLILSRAYTRRWLGILIDARNKYSLSRLQMMLWTIIILSAFVAAVLANIQLKLLVYVSGAVRPAQVIVAPAGRLVADALLEVGVLTFSEDGAIVAAEGVDLSQLDLAESLRDGQQIYVPIEGETSPNMAPTAEEDVSLSLATTPLSVVIPSEVWLLLGISTTSLVASPLIKSQRRKRIVSNTSMSEAKFSDLFKGEQASDYLQLDLAKVQMFYFTLIVVVAYIIAVASMLIRSQNYISSLPTLDGGVIALLGVSHAGYLTNKAVPRSEGDGGQTGGAEG